MMSLRPLRKLVNPHRPITYGIVQAGPDFPGGVPYVRPVDMTDTHGVVDEASLQRTAPEIAHAYRRAAVLKGDLIVSIGPSYGKVMIVPASLQGANLTQGTARVAPGPDVDVRWLFWALQSAPCREFWDTAVGGATFRALNLGPLGETPLSVPPVEEQRRIADFLDGQVARIDTVRANGQDELRLLAEKRLTLVSAMVGSRVGGDQGALGSGLRPVHGTVRPLRSVASVQSGFTMGSRHEGTGSRFPYMRVANVQDGRLDLTEVKTIELPQSVAARHRLAPGDVLLTEGNGNPANLGRGAVWRGSEEPTLHQNHVFAVRPRARILDSDYLAFCLESAWGRTYFAATAAQVGIASTSRSKLAALPLVVPGFSAQKQLVRQLEDALAEAARLVHSVETRGHLLEERKRSLITAAVTGALDVSSASLRAAEAVVGVR